MSCPYYHWDHGYACMKTGKTSTTPSTTSIAATATTITATAPSTKHEDSSSSSGCFLTSACVEAKGLPDDCRELATLRRYRDEYLAKQECGQCEIDHYYHIAPQIVEKIKARPDALAVFERIYNELVIPCVRFIDAGDMEAAHALYRDCVLTLEKEYLRK